MLTLMEKISMSQAFSICFTFLKSQLSTFSKSLFTSETFFINIYFPFVLQLLNAELFSYTSLLAHLISNPLTGGGGKIAFNRIFSAVFLLHSQFHAIAFHKVCSRGKKIKEKAGKMSLRGMKQWQKFFHQSIQRF